MKPIFFAFVFNALLVAFASAASWAFSLYFSQLLGSGGSPLTGVGIWIGACLFFLATYCLLWPLIWRVIGFSGNPFREFTRSFPLRLGALALATVITFYAAKPIGTIWIFQFLLVLGFALVEIFYSSKNELKKQRSTADLLFYFLVTGLLFILTLGLSPAVGLLREST